jgi:hypothetical protein
MRKVYCDRLTDEMDNSTEDETGNMEPSHSLILPSLHYRSQ